MANLARNTELINSSMKKAILTAALLGIAALSYAQGSYPMGYSDSRTEGMKPEMSEFYAPQPKKVCPGNAMVAGAPSDAIVLFDGTNLDSWCGRDGQPAGWTVNADGTMTVNKQFGDIRTKDSFGDFQLHIEWKVPEDIEGSNQARGNSGVFLQDRYEVQVLDVYENETYTNGMAGAIYKQSTPLVNPCRKPGEWNVYDIIYTAPTFKEDGSYRTRPYVTVIFNGVLVQNHQMILGTTEYIGWPKYEAHGDGPISLQSHGDPSAPISFRNIWIRKL